MTPFSTRRTFVVTAQDEIGAEVDDPELLAFPVEVVDVVATSPALIGKTLGGAGEPARRGGRTQCVTYAVGNVLLALWGSVIVALT